MDPILERRPSTGQEKERKLENLQGFVTLCLLNHKKRMFGKTDTQLMC